MENPIVTLGEKCQKMFGASMQTRVVGKTGADHCPEIEVEIELPNGRIFTGKAGNQKEAKKLAAIEALKTL